MLPESGAFELAFLAIVALIVVGPKDLPVLLRKLGQFTAKMRGLASEFRSSFDEMARQSELDDLRREVEALRDGRFGEPASSTVETSPHEPPPPDTRSDTPALLTFDDHVAQHGPVSLSREPHASAEAEVEPELPFPAAETQHPSHAPDAAHVEAAR